MKLGRSRALVLFLLVWELLRYALFTLVLKSLSWDGSLFAVWYGAPQSAVLFGMLLFFADPGQYRVMLPMIYAVKVVTMVFGTFAVAVQGFRMIIGLPQNPANATMFFYLILVLLFVDVVALFATGMLSRSVKKLALKEAQ